MEHIYFDQIPNISSAGNRGGRVSSAKLRDSLQQSEIFNGLGEGINHYDLLLLVKRTGKDAGFTSKMISLLDYYMAYTRPCDWEQGGSPIVYQSLSRTAMDMGISERQIQRLEQALFEVGAMTWQDSGNHKRYGVRGEDGKILYAYGVDLSPLAFLKQPLENLLQDKELRQKAWMEMKRKISWYRRSMKSMMAEMEKQGREVNKIEAAYVNISYAVRAHLSLEKVKELKDAHEKMYQTLLAEVEMLSKTSCKSDINFMHYNSTIKKQSDKSDTSRDKPASFQKSSKVNFETKIESDDDADQLILQTGLQNITLKQALAASSENFRAHMPMDNRPMNWNDFVEAAYRMKIDLSISQNSWANACSLMSRNGAAICLLLTDRARLRDHKPVEKTGAYFNAMINRAKDGELHLHKSIMALIKRD